MKPTLINHPLKVIQLEYKSNKPLSAFEEQAVLEYVKLHDALHEQVKQQAVMEPQLKPLQDILVNCESQLEMLELMLSKCGVLAGYTKEEQDKANERFQGDE